MTKDAAASADEARYTAEGRRAPIHFHMQLFNKLMSKIFGHGSPSTSSASGSVGGSPASAPAGGSSAPAGSAPMPGTAASGGATPSKAVDVNAVLNDMASKNSEKLDWKRSIVDLMKLVGMDSSLSARKELATELGYTGDKDDSAAMNIWLHKQVLRKLSENGGKVPQDLLD
jgi:hypothetical protein